jgi:hypothetical protein
MNQCTAFNSKLQTKIITKNDIHVDLIIIAID